MTAITDVVINFAINDLINSWLKNWLLYDMICQLHQIYQSSQLKLGPNLCYIEWTQIYI